MALPAVIGRESVACCLTNTVTALVGRYGIRVRRPESGHAPHTAEIRAGHFQRTRSSPPRPAPVVLVERRRTQASRRVGQAHLETMVPFTSGSRSTD